ncbi:MAG: hypothetical protein K9M57_04310 [Phycisphaerae bacterium]|nr:hypothetical protein [Phycisphaerae bacterium]
MKKQFVTLWNGLGAEGDPDLAFQYLYDSYTQPGRFYHNLNHVEACLMDFRKGRVGVLQTFLEKSSIYSLNYFKDKYQAQAVGNIQKAVSDLL